MELTDPKQGLPNLADIRVRKEKILSSVYKDPRELSYQVDWEVFIAAEPEQITRELVTNVLKGREYTDREEANKSLAKDADGWIAAWRFNVWSKVDDALKGATGKERVSKTIEFLREEAALWRRLKDDNLKILQAGGPFEGNPFQEMDLLKQQNGIWEHIATNHDTAARLFENSPNLEVGLA